MSTDSSALHGESKAPMPVVLLPISPRHPQLCVLWYVDVLVISSSHYCLITLLAQVPTLLS